MPIKERYTFFGSTLFERSRQVGDTIPITRHGFPATLQVLTDNKISVEPKEILYHWQKKSTYFKEQINNEQIENSVHVGPLKLPKFERIIVWLA